LAAAKPPRLRWSVSPDLFGRPVVATGWQAFFSPAQREANPGAPKAFFDGFTRQIRTPILARNANIHRKPAMNAKNAVILPNI
jgi:hypothetical protein